MDLSKFNVDNLSATELGCIGTSVVFMGLALCAAFLSRRFWLLTDAALQGFGGLSCLIIPAFTLRSYSLEKLQKGLTIDELDGVHLHLARSVGIMMLGLALTSCRLSDRDSDPTVFTSIVWSKIVTYSLAAINLIYSVVVYGGVEKSKSGLWTYSDIIFFAGLVTIALMIISGVIQLGRVQSWGGYPETFNLLNLHVRLDYFFTLVFGIIVFAMPHWFLQHETTLEKIGNLHVYQMRVFAIMCISSALMMGRAPNFLRDDDKVTLLECRVVQNVVLMGAQMYAHNWSHDFTNIFVFFGMGGTALWTLNAAIGYWSVRGYPKLKLN